MIQRLFLLAFGAVVLLFAIEVEKEYTKMANSVDELAAALKKQAENRVVEREVAGAPQVIIREVPSGPPVIVFRQAPWEMMSTATVSVFHDVVSSASGAMWHGCSGWNRRRGRC